MRELGFAGFDVSAWLGLAVPAATDGAIVRRLHEEVAKAVADEGVRGKLAAAGAGPALRGPEEFQALVRQEIPRWAKVIEAGGVTAD